jgi:type I restriction enzyme S subunit
MELMTKQGAALSLSKGYKQTEVGMIPEDWKVGVLGDLCSKVTDGTHDTPKPISEGIPFLTAIHVKENKIHFQDCYFLPEEVHNEIYQRCNPEKHDVLMVNIGAGAGTTALIKVDYEFSLKNVALLKTSNKIDGSYLNNILIKRKSKILKDFIAGGAQPFLALGQISKIQIPIPPTLTEQKAIATALSDVDALIASLEQTITKKKAIKQGAMQQLLTPPHKGGKRLPGFSGEWVEKNLGEFCKITTGKLDANAMVSDGDYRFYTCARKFYYIDRFAFDTEALLVSGNGANVGYIHYYQGKFNAYQRTYVLDDFSSNIHFMKCLLDKYLSLRIESEKNDGNTPYIKMDTLTEMYLNLPSDKNEQKAIAQILSDMDAELDKLETKKAKYQAIKQGMMQELLTGKTRLI